MEIISKSIGATRRLGIVCARKLLQIKTINNSGTALTIALLGNLGSGKTTFVQGFAKGLKIKKKILSPTFVILKKFKIQNSKFKNFYHIDFYRIKKSKEILNLDFRKIISDSKNILAIEWPEKIKKILPKNAIWVKFKMVDEKKRKIKLWSKAKFFQNKKFL